MTFHFLSAAILQKITWIISRPILTFYGRLTVKGLENFAHIRSPILFVCNHSSEVDALMVPTALPFFSRFSPLIYAVREKEFYEGNGWRKHIFNTWFINACGGYGAIVGLRDYGKSLAKHISLLQEGYSFCIFPEGGITRDGQIQPAKGGVSFLAHSSPCLIVPVGISGVYGMSGADFFGRKRKITVSFGLPIDPAQIYREIYDTSDAPHASGENMWKKEANYLMQKVGELLEK